MSKIAEVLFLVVLALVISLPLIACFALPVMWLWNDLVPGLFHVRAISFGEAFELLLLCMLLVKGGSGATIKS